MATRNVFCQVLTENTTLSVYINGLHVGSLDASTLDSTTQQRALMHGLEQKLRDSVASLSKDPDGAMKGEATIKGVISSLKSGNWRQKGGIDTTAIRQDATKKAIVSMAEAMVVAGATEDIVRATLEPILGVGNTEALLTQLFS